ncbi:hypothetical protein Kpol_1052p26 [Vanderwaltozyma polyspora DSM 70294]|uniref:OTU domain-containing protein n=1 Tax=Vanderwaltozyma polyspora (strain ATCC 22028 / DSM 70294 / BCRC 21397 / CBS 2163 / NBRC 10782 / NRRL Y-8283 / UCD 57-17) TaxID=436907 RepID=A7TM37_VANPO|nr:uncharacterized protein Kpol_1052p26 [Vanderwaltozyma polyspora DSM 70294]EDO16679.1 hypothetical protein Kpol_1052p26 [Vanderwaltozyma polyspora DSM 70294]
MNSDIVEESYDEMVKRHLKEQKDLSNKINSMKGNMKKSNRKQIMDNCKNLQFELDEKHKKELNRFSNGNDGIENEDEDEITPEMLLAQLSIETKQQDESKSDTLSSTANTNQPRKSRNRQKERLAKRQQKIEKIKEEAREEAANQPNYQEIEQTVLDDYCLEHKFVQYDIKPDGHCLFASILDQLTISINNSNNKIQYNDVSELRKLSCEYVDKNRDDFIPFMFDETTGDLKDLDEYIKEISETAKWGGEIELLSLSKSLNVTIKVVMANLNNNSINFHIINESDDNSLDVLNLVYYKHSYSLGEHYNSLRPMD